MHHSFENLLVSMILVVFFVDFQLFVYFEHVFEFYFEFFVSIKDYVYDVFVHFYQILMNYDTNQMHYLVIDLIQNQLSLIFVFAFLMLVLLQLQNNHEYSHYY